MVAFRRLKQLACCLVGVVLLFVVVLRWNSTRTGQEVFGPTRKGQEVFEPTGVPGGVVAASSRDLYSRLNTNDTRSCSDEERTLTFRYLQVRLVCQSEPCYVWYWDVANWTLIYTREKMATNAGSRFCPIPIHGERTARIIQPNGTVDYPGCTNEKYPCAAMPLFAAYFDKKLQLRINRSPCCRKLLVEITQHMGRVFDKYNITYFLLSGVVISLVRDNGVLIPYDTDTDVAVDVNDLEKVEKALPDLEKPGYKFKWKMEYTNGQKRYMVGCTNEHCLTGPGIALYSVKGDNIEAPVTNWRPLPVNLTIPPIRRKFEGVEMGYPRDPEGFLDFYYGKDKWRTPLHCTKHYYDQCSE